MRNLTITRIKSAVACTAAMKVYIQDEETQELTIGGVPCRKLGNLKNGETASFAISDRAAKVFVIADKASRNYSNDYYPIPAGTEDVTIAGKNKYSPFIGNPFRFEGVTDPEVLANRKKGNGKATIIAILALIVGFGIGFAKNTFLSVDTVKPQDFSAAGMTITLTNQFEETDYEGFTQCYESKSVAVMTLKEEFTLMEGLDAYTVEDYGRLVLASNGMDESWLTQENGIWYFSYVTQGGDGADYYYFATLHKSGDAFWLIQFATPATNESKLHDQFLAWAADVTFE